MTTPHLVCRCRKEESRRFLFNADADRKVSIRAHSMQTLRRHAGIALLMAVHYLALALALPFLHNDGGVRGASGRTAVRNFAVSHTPAGSSHSCPSCEWDQIA